MRYVVAGLVAALGVVLAVVDGGTPPAPPRVAIFCRVWPPGAVPPPGTTVCIRRPASFRPPWPYVGPDGTVITPRP